MHMEGESEGRREPSRLNLFLKGTASFAEARFLYIQSCLNGKLLPSPFFFLFLFSFDKLCLHAEPCAQSELWWQRGHNGNVLYGVGRFTTGVKRTKGFVLSVAPVLVIHLPLPFLFLSRSIFAIIAGV